MSWQVTEYNSQYYIYKKKRIYYKRYKMFNCTDSNFFRDILSKTYITIFFKNIYNGLEYIITYPHNNTTRPLLHHYGKIFQKRTKNSQQHKRQNPSHS